MRKQYEVLCATRGKWSLRRHGSGLPSSAKQWNGSPFVEWATLEAKRPEEEAVPGAGEIKSIARIYQGDGEVGSPGALREQLSNGLLISAAPDLYAACVRAIELIDGTLGGLRSDRRGDMRNARNILADARDLANGFGVVLNEEPDEEKV